MKRTHSPQRTSTPRARRARGWLIVALLAVMTAAGSFVTPSTASAQDKSETKVEAFDSGREKVSKKGKGLQKKPSFKGNANEREFVLKAQKKRDEAIKLLKELIDTTDDSDPEKPEFRFQVSELLWEKSKFFERKAFKTQDEMYAAEDRKDAKGVKRLKQRMMDELELSKRMRNEAVKEYAAIIQNHKDFKDLDKVYFYLGYNLVEVGKRPQALSIFREMLKQFPKSDYVPNVLLAYGDYYFDNDDMEQAQAVYNKVLTYEGSDLRAYAAYKLAWCSYNLTEYDKALNQFLDVIKITEKGQFKNDKALRKEALKDVVQTYLHIGTPSKAIGFFKKLVKNDQDVYFMAQRLAELYQDAGKFKDSTSMYKKLISLNSKSFKIMDYQIEIVRNVEAVGIRIDAVKELVRAMKLFEKAKTFKDADPKTTKTVRRNLELILREYATGYHRDAQQTGNEETYAFAYNLYKAYLESFPDSPDLYIMTFFYGELIYRLAKKHPNKDKSADLFAEAAVQYDKTIDLKPDGKYTKDAVHGAVLSYQKAVEVSYEREEIADAIEEPEEEKPEAKPKGRRGKRGKVAKKEPKKPDFSRKELTPEHKKLIRACERYIKFNPNGSDVGLVRYSAARTYYDFNQFDKAEPLFWEIVKNHPTENVGEISANLILDILLIEKRTEELPKAIGDIRASFKDNPNLEARFLALEEQATFISCNGIEDKQEWVKAAKCFVEFYKKFPDSTRVDKALWNAALNYERAKQIGKAVNVRLGLAQVRPQSPLMPDNVFNIAGNYHALATYSQASKYYELFVLNFPEDEKAEKALRFAATFRQGLGEDEKAIGAYEEYLRLFGQKDKKKGGEVFYQIGVIYEKNDKPRKALAQYSDYVRKWGKEGPPDRLLQAQMKLAMADWNNGKVKQAMKGFDQVLATYKKMPKDTKAKLTTGADAAAQATFMKGEAAFKELSEIKLKLPEKKLQASLIKKIKGYTDAEKIYTSIFAYSRPDWTLAALYRIGSLYQDFAKEIRNSPVPKGLTYDQEEIYRGGLEEKAAGIEENAIKMYEKCLEAALAKSWFNEYSRKAEVGLGELMPGKYRKPSELRAQPNKFSRGLKPTPFTDEAITEEKSALVAETKKEESP